MFVPYSGGRVAFVHQSVTEFLAASELARRYESNPRVLKEKLANRRWDQALFLCLSLVPTQRSERRSLEHVIKADFALGLRAAKFLEVGRDEVVARLLSEIPGRIHEWGSFREGDRSPPWRSACRFAMSTRCTCVRLITLGDSIGASRRLPARGIEGRGS